MNLVWVSISLWGTFALPGQGYITIRKCARNPRKKTNYNIFSVKTFVRQTTAQWKPLNHITFKWNLYFLFLSIQGIHSSFLWKVKTQTHKTPAWKISGKVKNLQFYFYKTVLWWVQTKAPLDHLPQRQPCLFTEPPSTQLGDSLQANFAHKSDFMH